MCSFILFELQYSVTLQSEEQIAEACRKKGTSQQAATSVTTYSKHHEFCLHTAKTHIAIPVPLTATPGFQTDIGKETAMICACKRVRLPKFCESKGIYAYDSPHIFVIVNWFSNRVSIRYQKSEIRYLEINNYPVALELTLVQSHLLWGESSSLQSQLALRRKLLVSYLVISGLKYNSVSHGA